MEDKDIFENDPVLLLFFPCCCGREFVRSSALRMICDACWSSCSLVSNDVELDPLRRPAEVGVIGLETEDSREVEELDRLKGRPPLDGVCVEVLASGGAVLIERGWS